MGATSQVPLPPKAIAPRWKKNQGMVLLWSVVQEGAGNYTTRPMATSEYAVEAAATGPSFSSQQLLLSQLRRCSSRVGHFKTSPKAQSLITEKRSLLFASWSTFVVGWDRSYLITTGIFLPRIPSEPGTFFKLSTPYLRWAF